MAKLSKTRSKKSGGVLCQRVAVRYASVEKMRLEYPVCLVCVVLLCSVSGYYSWRKSLHLQRCPKDAELKIALVAAH